MPLFPTSTHLRSKGWKAKISREGCSKERQLELGQVEMKE